MAQEDLKRGWTKLCQIPPTREQRGTKQGSTGISSAGPRLQAGHSNWHPRASPSSALACCSGSFLACSAWDSNGNKWQVRQLYMAIGMFPHGSLASVSLVCKIEMTEISWWQAQSKKRHFYLSGQWWGRGICTAELVINHPATWIPPARLHLPPGSLFTSKPPLFSKLHIPKGEFIIHSNGSEWQMPLQ